MASRAIHFITLPGKQTLAQSVGTCPLPPRLHSRPAHRQRRYVPAYGYLRRALLLMLLAAAGELAVAQRPGEFSGKVVVEWLEGREARMRLLEDFAFTDARGQNWPVPRGHTIDGLNIPRVFHSFSGPPFSGAQRKAVLLHDYYAKLREREWREVHRLFYDAAHAAGVAENDAKIMYMSIYAQGMRWEVKGSTCYRGCHASRTMLDWRPEVDETDLRPVVEWIDQENPSLDAIDARADQAIKRPGPHLFVQQPHQQLAPPDE